METKPLITGGSCLADSCYSETVNYLHEHQNGENEDVSNEELAAILTVQALM